MDEASYYNLKAMPALAPSLSSEVAAQVGRSIVTGAYSPGSLLEDEAALAIRFGVSRTVIRDAMKVLVGKGLLEVRRGIGTRIKPREEWGLLDDDVMAWQLSVPADPAMLLQLAETRQLFEPQAAFWAAERATPAELDEIGSAINAMQDEVDDPRKFVVADARFHRAVLRAAHNEFLLALAGIIYSALLSSIRLTNPDRDTILIILPFHEAVSDAIIRGNSEEAKARMAFLIKDAVCRINAVIAAV
ncbi:FadR/GntR family transcriptional regulator [Granulosicoccus sp. 3-233]|uniref:FadR/GntR family transcriptional regulator n=1 Tax=Granulosicoccus sp. 3-233 TaxID=3417969 RepID=UPI003D34E308